MRFTACVVLALSTIAVTGQSPDSLSLYEAIRADDIPRLKTLLDGGAAVDEPIDGAPLLMHAAAAGSIEAMGLLLGRGADVNAKNTYGATALMWSVTDPAKVKLLLDRGADVNVAARSGRTALIVAAFTNPSAPVVRMLLDKGAKVGVMDGRKVTPLNAATYANDTETVRMLLDASADIHTADTFIGLNPIINAAGNRNLDAVKLLLARGADVNAVSMTENLPRIQTGIVEFGGWTPLLMAVPFGPPALVRTLIDAGAKVNVKDYRGLTPLMLAVAHDRPNLDVTRLLLASRADTQLKDRDGKTATDWAARYAEPGVMRALGSAAPPAPVSVALPAQTPDVRTAVTRSVALLERATTQFFRTGGCVACHAQPAAAYAAGGARAKGLAIDEPAAAARWAQLVVGLNGTQMEGAAPLGGADNNLYVAEALIRSGYRPDRKTDILAANLAAYQAGDGGWHLPGYTRSPLQDNDFSRTAMALRALKTYGTPGRAAEMRRRIERGKQWLLRATPVTVEDHAMRLTGVATAGATDAELRRLAATLLSRQRADGGFAQRDGLASDAYATGMVLWSLANSGVATPADEVYRKGVRFLLGTQAADGSWHVRSRATKFQIYFESGFPYGHDQWISSIGTGWAASALAAALEGGR